MVLATRRQIIGGGAPINKSRRRSPQIVGGAARPAHGSNFGVPSVEIVDIRHRSDISY